MYFSNALIFVLRNPVFYIFLLLIGLLSFFYLMLFAPELLASFMFMAFWLYTMICLVFAFGLYNYRIRLAAIPVCN